MKYSDVMKNIPIKTVGDKLSTWPMDAVRRMEQGYFQRVLSLCNEAIDKERHTILITGPSASGKTTTAKQVVEELRARGYRVNRISMDNFYKTADELPRWSDGYQNYEAIEGLDLDCFETTLATLYSTGRAQFPIFDFNTGKRAEKTFELTHDENTFLIVEGIHALNPALSATLAQVPSMKVYISIHSNFVDENGEIILRGMDLRLLRRLIRDFYHRGTPAPDTFHMWDYVVKGEELYIYPFRENADVYFNSTHNYEPFLYHDEALAMLGQIPADSRYRETIDRLIESLAPFFSIDRALVPDDSLLQEFIKRGGFKKPPTFQ